MKDKLITILVLLFPIVVSSQEAERMDSLMHLIQNKGFNGNVLYSKGDSIVFKGNYGYQELDKKTPLNDSTLFELASCSKQFTALAIVQLIEKDSIGYTTKVDEIIENFPYEDITIEHLLRHQSGIPDYMRLLKRPSVWKKKKIATNQDVIEALQKFKPKSRFTPGTSYEYSNTGYLILASIIEKVSKMSFEDYLKENIFIPAGMERSRVYRRRYKPEDISNITQGYTYDKSHKKYVLFEKRKENRYVYWLDGIVGDGMVNSTILDLEKWKQAIRYNILISEKSKEKMFSTDSVSTNYGHGFEIKNSDDVGKLIYHSGVWSGYLNFIIFLPNSNEYVVVLCNNNYRGFSEILNGILELRE